MKRFCVHATQLCNGSQFIYHYSKVSNRRGLWNSRGGWEKYQKAIVGEGGGGSGGGGLEKTENYNTWGVGF